MDKFFPSWLSAKAFLLCWVLTAIGVFDHYSASESVVGFLVATLTGGLLWGWVLTKFLPRWFGKSKPGPDG